MFFWTMELGVLIPTMVYCFLTLWLLLITTCLGSWFRKNIMAWQRELYGELSDLPLFHFFCITRNVQMIDVLTMFGVKDTPYRGVGEEHLFTGMTCAARNG